MSEDCGKEGSAGAAQTLAARWRYTLWHVQADKLKQKISHEEILKRLSSTFYVHKYDLRCNDILTWRWDRCSTTTLEGSWNAPPNVQIKQPTNKCRLHSDYLFLVLPRLQHIDIAIMLCWENISLSWVEEPQSLGCRPAGRGSWFEWADCSAAVEQAAAGGMQDDPGWTQPGCTVPRGIQVQLNTEKEHRKMMKKALIVPKHQFCSSLKGQSMAKSNS